MPINNRQEKLNKNGLNQEKLLLSKVILMYQNNFTFLINYSIVQLNYLEFISMISQGMESFINM